LLNRVEPCSRLVKDDRHRIGHNGRCQSDPLAIAPRELANEPTTHIKEPTLAADLLISLPRNAPIEPSTEAEILIDPKLLAGWRPVWQPAEHPMSLAGLLQNIKAMNKGSPRSWLQDTSKHSHGRRLASTVRTEKTGHRPSFNLEGDIIHRRDGSETAGHVNSPNHPIKSTPLQSWMRLVSFDFILST
jgi:hypothetical protein